MATPKRIPVLVGEGDVRFTHASEGYFDIEQQDDVGKWKSVLVLGDAEMQDFVNKAQASLNNWRGKGKRSL